MRSPPSQPHDDRTDKIALFLTQQQVRWLVVSLGALPRDIRKPIERTIDRQLAEHREVH